MGVVEQPEDGQHRLHGAEQRTHGRDEQFHDVGVGVGFVDLGEQCIGPLPPLRHRLLGRLELCGEDRAGVGIGRADAPRRQRRFEHGGPIQPRGERRERRVRTVVDPSDQVDDALVRPIEFLADGVDPSPQLGDVERRQAGDVVGEEILGPQRFAAHQLHRPAAQRPEAFEFRPDDHQLGAVAGLGILIGIVDQVIEVVYDQLFELARLAVAGPLHRQRQRQRPESEVGETDRQRERWRVRES